MNCKKIFKKFTLITLTAFTLANPIASIRPIRTHAATSNAEKVVQYAKTKTYITSRPNEVTNFYGIVCDWCSMFVYYCAYQNGVGSSVPNTTFCDSQYGYKGGVEIFKNWGKWQNSAAKGGKYTPVTGDVIYFDWNLDGYSDHVGYVDYVSDGYVHTVEGNSGTYGDCVKLNKYQLSYRNILGYGTPDWGDTATVSKKIVPVAAEVKPTVKITATKSNVKLPAEYKVSSPVGAWLREEGSSTGRKIGILSTDQRVVADQIKGDWVHLEATNIEESTQKFSGWTAVTNLTFIENITPATTTSTTKATSTTTKTTSTTTKTTTSTTKTTTTTTQTTTKSTTSTTTKATTTTTSTTAPATTTSAGSYDLFKVASPIGAWFRSTPEFGSNTLGILDTDSLVFVYSSDGEWATAQASLDGGRTFRNGYVHLSTLAPAQGGNSGKYKVTSAIGCRFRTSPVINDTNTLSILNTGDTFKVISVKDEWAFAEVSTSSGTKYGFIHTSNIEKI